MNYPSDFTPELRNKPICGVLSVAMLANVTFARATQAIKNNLMPWQKRHGGKTYHEQRLNALRELGVNFVQHPTPAKQTLERWVLTSADPSKVYAVQTTKHVVTVKDGIVVDQYEINPIEKFGAKRCFVREVVEVL